MLVVKPFSVLHASVRICSCFCLSHGRRSSLICSNNDFASLCREAHEIVSTSERAERTSSALILVDSAFALHTAPLTIYFYAELLVPVPQCV